MIAALKDRVSPVLLTAFVLRIAYILIAQTYIFPVQVPDIHSHLPQQLTD